MFSVVARQRNEEARPQGLLPEAFAKGTREKTSRTETRLDRLAQEMQELRRNMQAEKQRVTARETHEDARRKILLGSLCVPYGDEDLQAKIATRITAHLPAGEQEVWPAPFPLVDAEKMIEAAGNVRDPNAAERGAGDAGVTAKNSECALTRFSARNVRFGRKRHPEEV